MLPLIVTMMNSKMMTLTVFPDRSRRIHEESRRNIQRLEEGGTKRRRYALPEEEEEMQVSGEKLICASMRTFCVLFFSIFLY